MSQVRMCDKCGRVFSELADDWQTFTVTQRKKDKETGRVSNEVIAMDACPECSFRDSPEPTIKQLNAQTTVVSDVRPPTNG